MKVIQKRATLFSRIDQFAKQGKERQQEAHTLAVSALYHAHKHGDLTGLTRLYHSFGKTENPNEYRYWLGIMTGQRVKWDKENAQFVQKAKGETVQGNCDIERAKREPWWELEKVQQNRDFDPHKDVQGVVGILNRHATEARNAGEEELAQFYERHANEAKTMAERMTMKAQQKEASVKEVK